MKQRKVHKWAERFKVGQTRVVDDTLSGRTSTLTRVELRGESISVFGASEE
jgi:hypothetical protein